MWEEYDNIHPKNKDKILKNIESICRKISETKHINVVVLGREGVGKSTLVNSALKLTGDDKAETGEGDSITKKISLYTNKENGFLRIYDTEGVGIEEKNSPEKIFKGIEDLIESKIFNENANPDDLIHCIWYCINCKMTKIEFDLLEKLSKKYTEKTLPIILVHTKTFSKKQAKKCFDALIKKRSEDFDFNKDNFCIVLAQDDEDEDGKKAFGLDELLEKTRLKIELAVDSANYNFLKYHIFLEIDNLLSYNMKNSNLKQNYNYSFNNLKKDLVETVYNEFATYYQIITAKDINDPKRFNNNFTLFFGSVLDQAESKFNQFIDELGKEHATTISEYLFESYKQKQLQKQFYYHKYLEDINLKKYPFTKLIEKKVCNYLFDELKKKQMNILRGQ